MSYLYLDGTAGTFVTLPDLAAYDTAGDIDIRVGITPDLLTGAQYWCGRENPTLTWRFAIANKLPRAQIWDSNDVSETETGTAITANVRERLQLRTAVDFGGSVSPFYRTDAVAEANALDSDASWTAVSGDVLTNTDLKQSASLIVIGATGFGGSPLPGQYHRFLFYHGTDSTGIKQIDVDFTNLTQAEVEAGVFVEDSVNAATVTINGDTWAYVNPVTSGVLGRAERLYQASDRYTEGSPKWPDLSGNDNHAQNGSTAGADTNDGTYSSIGPYWIRTTDDYHEAAPLAFGAADDFTLMTMFSSADVTPAADGILIAEKDDLTTAIGVALYLDTSGVPKFVIDDGTNPPAEATGPALTDDTRHVIAAVRDTVADTITVYVDGIAGTPVTDSTVLTLAAAAEVRFGRLSGAGTSYVEGNDFADVAWREALSAADVAAAGMELEPGGDMMLLTGVG